MGNVKKVQVLLSAYNGEKYLAQQIDSILAQEKVEVSLLVRDDGSWDATPKLLKDYACRYENVCVYYGEHVGTQKSYFDLLSYADTKQDYYAFSDQDDVWCVGKLWRAVKLLEQEDCGPRRARLYASGVFCASEDLSVKKQLRCRIRKQPSFGNALVENLCMGCTEVFNVRLLELVKAHPPSCGIFHDWWVYMTAAYFGTVVFDCHAFILYRQHGQNQVGVQDNQIEKWKNRMTRFRELRGLVSRQAEDFANVYKDMHRKRPELELAIAYRGQIMKRLRIVFGHTVYRQGCLDQFIYRLLFASGFL